MVVNFILVVLVVLCGVGFGLEWYWFRTEDLAEAETGDWIDIAVTGGEALAGGLCLVAIWHWINN